VTDPTWRTRVVGVTIDGPGPEERIAIEADGEGNWSVTEGRLLFLDGCLDVDFEFSPATNTLPIRRLGLEVGEQAATSAAWVRFPERKVERIEQTHECLGEDRYRYSSGPFSAELVVRDDGLVVEYEGSWKAIAQG
ncbi:MAG: putative glycolipid-binding domain-containing protein, partial [Acidimicrobiia bacterium]